MVTIVSIASENFLPYLRALVVSARINYPSARVVVELINCPDSEVDAFKRNHHNITVMTKKTDKTGEDRRVFCMNRKAYAMLDIRHAGDTNTLLWIDADSYIRLPCQSIENVINHDLTLRLKSTSTIFNDVKMQECYSGVFAFGNTKRGNKMLRQYAESMTRGKAYWAADQDNVAYVYAINSQADLGILPKEYLDFKVGKASYIWTVKAEPKTINALFHRHQKTYLEQWING